VTIAALAHETRPGYRARVTNTIRESADPRSARAESDVSATVRKNWRIQFESTRDYLVPWLEESGALPSTGRVLEAGAGYAGCLAAFQHVCPRLACEGLELKSARAHLATRLFQEYGGRVPTIHQGDLTKLESLGNLSPPYDLIVLRDVIEHIEARPTALRNIRSLLSPSGAAVFTFPSYLSPYGGHQQGLRARLLRLPWIQLTPIFLGLVRRADPKNYEEMASIWRCHITTHSFTRDVREAGLEIVAERHFFLRPIFKYRYGLPVVRGGPLGLVPLAKDLFLTASWYIARANG
jgi:SAM-dependent methyltransferase